MTDTDIAEKSLIEHIRDDTFPLGHFNIEKVEVDGVHGFAHALSSSSTKWIAEYLRGGYTLESPILFTHNGIERKVKAIWFVDSNDVAANAIIDGVSPGMVRGFHFRDFLPPRIKKIRNIERIAPEHDSDKDKQAAAKKLTKNFYNLNPVSRMHALFGMLDDHPNAF